MRARPRPGLAGLKTRAFAFLQRRSTQAAEFFRMPTRGVVVLATDIEVYPACNNASIRRVSSVETPRSLHAEESGRAIGFSLLSLSACGAEPAVSVPAPSFDPRGTATGNQTAVLAGGCFWGVQGVYQHLRGVKNVLSGFAGGERGTAHYETVSGGDTGHAESVQIVYDPAQVTYGQILQVFFSVAHDPTQLNRQGPDSGPQYRSNIFYANDEQKQVALKYIAQLDQARVFPARIVTRVDPLKGFFAAEDYHQDYLLNHPDQPYIAFNDLPKVRNFARLLPALYNTTPVTVADSRRAPASTPTASSTSMMMSAKPQPEAAANEGGAMMQRQTTFRGAGGRGRHARAQWRRRLAELQAAEACRPARQGGGARLLDLLLHQLPAGAAVHQRLVPALQGLGPGHHRRALAGISLREGTRQRAHGGGEVRHPLSRGARQRHGHLECLRQPLLARALLRRRPGQDPRTSLFRRGQVRALRAHHPRVAGGSRREESARSAGRRGW